MHFKARKLFIFCVKSTIGQLPNTGSEPPLCETCHFTEGLHELLNRKVFVNEGVNLCYSFFQ